MMPVLAQGRPAGGHQISLWLVVGVADDSQSGGDLPRPRAAPAGGKLGLPIALHARPRARLAAQARRRRHPDAARPEQRLYQARHRPSRRHGRGARRAADPQRQAGASRWFGRRRWCRSTPMRRATKASWASSSARPTARFTAACRSSARRFPAGRATTRSTLARARAMISARSRFPPGHVFLMGDNRDRSADSRFALGPPNNGPGRPGAVGEYRRARRVHHLLVRRLDPDLLNPLTWFSSLRSGRAGDSLRADRGLSRMAEGQADRRTSSSPARPNFAIR